MRPTTATEVVVRSDGEDGDVRIPLDTAPGDVAGWAGYVAGVMWALRGAGHRIQGGTMSIASDVEMGSGVASSAALECAVLGALATAQRPAHRSDRAGAHRAASRERLCRRAHRDDGPTGLAVRRAAQGVDDRLSGADRAAGGVRPGRLRYRPAADQFACAAPACGRRVCASRRSSCANGRQPTWACRRCGRCRTERRGGSRRGDRPGRCAQGPAHPDRQPACARCRCGAGGVGLHRDRAALQARRRRPCATTSRSPPTTSI